ncbi:MAG: phage major capsid protein [Thermodesulfobacteriota bacterium]
MKDLHTLIEKQGVAFEDFIKANSGRLEKLETAYSEIDKELREVVKKANRPFYPGGGNSGADLEAMTGYLRTGDTSMLAAAERKAATVGSDPSGGYLVPEQVDAQIGSIREQNNPMRQICRVIRPETTEYKKIVTTSRPSSGWVGETQARTETDSPGLEVVTPYWGGLYANPAASQDLIEDSAFDVAEWFRSEVAKEFSDQEGEGFISGNGIVKPRGLLDFPTAATGDATRPFGTIQYVPSGDANNLTPDSLLDLVYSLKSRYRQNAKWLLNSLTLATLRKLKDGDGQYLWRPGLEAGQPSLLLGYPVFEADFMPDVAADAYPIAFGDFQQAYWIFDRPTTVLRDPYTNKPFVNFYTATRVGSMLANSEAVKVLKVAAA